MTHLTAELFFRKFWNPKTSSSFPSQKTFLLVAFCLISRFSSCTEWGRAGELGQ